MPDITFTPLAHSATPYSIAYRLTAGEDPATLAYEPTMKAQLVPGPLKTELARRAADTTSGLSTLNLDANGGARVRIYIVSALNVKLLMRFNDFKLAWSKTGLGFEASYEGVNPEDLVIEIRFIHSSRR